MPSPNEKRLPPQAAQSVVQLGLRANWQQFTLLVIVNAFVGGMVGLERSIVPLLGQRVFGLASTTAVLSFIVSFGVVKASSNLFAGRLSDRIGRKGVLVVGWLVGLPVPLLIIFAPSWGWVVFANAAGYLAATYALRPQPFLLGIGFAMAGLLLSLFFVRESHGHARQEAAMLATAAGQTEGSAEQVQRSDQGPHAPSFKDIFWLTSWKNRTLFGVSQAGLVNNLNDGLAWGVFPLFFAAGGLPLAQIGLLAGIYPGVWGTTQLLTGALSDRIGRKGMIVGGMLLQGATIGLLPLLHGFGWWAPTMALLGLGAALVYPTLLATIADVAHPDWRASAVGVYRLWRDSGYAIGAGLSGVLADLFGVSWAIGVIGGVTFLSGVVVSEVMRETLPARRESLRSTRHTVS